MFVSLVVGRYKTLLSADILSETRCFLSLICVDVTGDACAFVQPHIRWALFAWPFYVHHNSTNNNDSSDADEILRGDMNMNTYDIIIVLLMLPVCPPIVVERVLMAPFGTSMLSTASSSLLCLTRMIFPSNVRPWQRIWDTWIRISITEWQHNASGHMITAKGNRKKSFFSVYKRNKQTTTQKLIHIHCKDEEDAETVSQWQTVIYIYIYMLVYNV